MQLLERLPKRPNSKVARVYPFLKAGEPRYVIEEKTGLSGTDLTEAIRVTYRMGFLPKPPLEERRRKLSEHTSWAKGGESIAIKPYEKLDLTARQTQVALAVFDGKHYSQEEIARAYGRRRRRYGLQRPVRELTIEAQRDKRRSEGELLAIVKSRKAAAAFLEAHGLEKPRTLEEWIVVEALAAQEHAQRKLRRKEPKDSEPAYDLRKGPFRLDNNRERSFDRW